MKALAASLLLLTLGSLHAQDPAPAAPATVVNGVIQEPTQEEIRNAKIVDLLEVYAKTENFAGKVVKVRFNTRGEKYEKQPDGLWQCWLNQSDSKSISSATATVVFPEKAMAWFDRLPKTYANKPKTLSAYVRVVENKSLYPKFKLELLGREAKIGAVKAELVW